MTMGGEPEREGEETNSRGDVEVSSQVGVPLDIHNLPALVDVVEDPGRRVQKLEVQDVEASLSAGEVRPAHAKTTTQLTQQAPPGRRWGKSTATSRAHRRGKPQVTFDTSHTKVGFLCLSAFVRLTLSLSH
ncbi:hypothetical protein HK096_005673 [Nowakowskiella sp. JEL0078]|nr:hypothetical protein HK096_005673 [Nowakowskiella sp. JEL0078]